MTATSSSARTSLSMGRRARSLQLKPAPPNARAKQLAFPSEGRRLLSIAVASDAAVLLLMSGSRTSLMVVLSCAAMRTVLRISHLSVGTRLSVVFLLIMTCVLVPVFGLDLYANSATSSHV